MHWTATILPFFFVNLLEVEVDTILLNLQSSCTPTASVKGPCHKCVCTSEAEFTCHAIACEKPNYANPRNPAKEECQPHMTYRYEELFCICDYEGKWMTQNCRDTFQYLQPNKIIARRNSGSNNTSKVYQDQDRERPQIQEGQSCVPGKLYKMYCNTCICGDNGSLVCTKMACIENAILNRSLRGEDKRRYEPKNVKTKRTSKAKSKKIERELKKDIKNKLPQLPKGDCVPGKIYRNGCTKCFCNEDNAPTCTKICRPALSSRVNDEEIAQLETRSAVDIPKLPHVGAECEPGKTYRVACNLCLCLEKHELLCTRKFCLNVNSYAEIQANKLSGRPCKEDYKKLCSECKCVNNKSKCKAMKRCNHSSSVQMLSSDGSKVKLTLDVKKDSCEPFATYKIHCNECYCQLDGTLRCTQKLCLNYSQIQKLKEREIYLEKHGL